MTKIEARVERERAAHEEDDVLARAYALKARFPHTTRSPAFLQMEADIKDAAGEVDALRVLDFGCGRGEMSLELLAGGASVVGIDISSSYIEAAAGAAAQAGHDKARYDFRVMDAHSLEFEDNTFDLVIGRGILHHLDYNRALSEVRRTLRPGGRAIFLEPLGSNPLLRIFRLMTPNARTEDERPFFAADLRRLRAVWNDHSRYYGIFCAPVSMATSVLMRKQPENFLLRAAWKAEQFFHARQWLVSWNQYVLFNLEKPQSASEL